MIKPAILVALLFRTLDAFRIFDNIYVLTGGANNTGSVSILGYDNLFKGFNVGLGSAISVLIFICRGDDRVHVHQAVRRRAGPDRRCARWPMSVVRRGAPPCWAVIDILVVMYALLPVLWILCLSLKPTSTVKDGKLIPS